MRLPLLVSPERHIARAAVKIVLVCVFAHMLLEINGTRGALAANMTRVLVDSLMCRQVAFERTVQLEAFAALRAVEIGPWLHDERWLGDRVIHLQYIYYQHLHIYRRMNFNINNVDCNHNLNF